MVVGVLCFQSAKLSKAFDFAGKAGNPKFRTSLSAAVMFLENSSQNES